MEEMSGKELCRIRQRLIDRQAEIDGINKILNYCSNWTDRLEMEMDGYLYYNNCGRGMDVIGEEFAIIDEMVKFCHKRIDELKDELNDISGWLSRYNHGDYDITCEWYKWFRSPYDWAKEEPPVNTDLCKVCKNENFCPYKPID